MDPIKRIKEIERHIKKLKEEGFNIFCRDSQYLVFEEKELSIKNDKQSYEDSSSGEIGYGSIKHNFTELESTYEINILK